MGSRSFKKQLVVLLAQRDLETILREIGKLPALEVVNGLFSAICHSDELIRWHAISCMGVTVARLAVEDMEQSRVVMRRFLWSLNDESGGIGWGAPEAMAEVMVNHKGLAREYLHMMLSYMRQDGEELFQDGNFLEHVGLQRGVLWGVGRLAKERGEMLLGQGIAPDLLPYLHSEDPEVRGLAVRAVGWLRLAAGVQRLRALRDEEATLRLYEEGTWQRLTVGELARWALNRITEGDPEK